MAELSDAESDALEYVHLSQLLSGEGVLQQATGFSQVVRISRSFVRNSLSSTAFSGCLGQEVDNRGKETFCWDT